MDLLKFNVPALTARVRIEQSNTAPSASAGGAGSRAGAAAEAKRAGTFTAGGGQGMEGVEEEGSAPVGGDHEMGGGS